MNKQRSAAKARIVGTLIATLAGMLIGAPFRCCRAQEGREHGPPAVTAPIAVALNTSNAAPFTSLSSSTLRVTPTTNASVLASTPHGVELRHAFVQHIVTRSFWGTHERFLFAITASDREERQRRQVAIHLGRAISQRGDAATAGRIETIYDNLRPAHWGRHLDGLLGGHFNFDYSAVRSVDIDRLLPHGRYGSFESLHFHHDQERVHLDAANPFGFAGLLAPMHLFVDVMAGHLP